MATKGTTLPVGHITEPSVQDDGHVTSHEHEADAHILHHHFDDMDQQREATTLGMWAFLVTEIMMFGGLFFVYTLFRWKLGDAFTQGSHMLNWKWGALNTGVLLVSSLTMAMAVHAAAERKRKQLIGFIVLTMMLGATFLGVKAIEWTADYHEGLMPSISWNPAHWPGHEGEHGGAGEPAAASGTTAEGRSAAATALSQGSVSSSTTRLAETGGYISGTDGQPVSTQHIMMYFVVYFCMTGLHAIHMIIGLAVLTVVMIMANKGAFTNGNDQPVELVGLYWHLVDIIWVFLFPLLYLIGGIKMGGH